MGGCGLDPEPGNCENTFLEAGDNWHNHGDRLLLFGICDSPSLVPSLRMPVRHR